MQIRAYIRWICITDLNLNSVCTTVHNYSILCSLFPNSLYFSSALPDTLEKTSGIFGTNKYCFQIKSNLGYGCLLWLIRNFTLVALWVYYNTKTGRSRSIKMYYLSNFYIVQLSNCEPKCDPNLGILSQMWCYVLLNDGTTWKIIMQNPSPN